MSTPDGSSSEELVPEPELELVPEQRLAGGNMGPVSRRGDVVLRTTGPWTPAVHRLLAHCRAQGMDGVPEPRGVETDDQHGERERLEYLPGDVPAYPMPAWLWAQEALDSATDLLRRFHAASATADRTGPWRSASHEPVEVLCHNDAAPYNMVFRDGRAVGLIDADHASPGPRVWDLAYLAYRIVPLTTDRADGFTDAQRDARLDRLLARYGEPAVTADVLRETTAERLDELAVFSVQKAVELDNPELAEHAALYERDALAIRARITDR
ncbi:phosphotransferase [Tersicoccus sp. MR15.9]|uniref:phosphotransferase n=1 Tax=Tersicoccus mangrovi TaxID=3121635 RepID=UPI002FE5FF95